MLHEAIRGQAVSGEGSHGLERVSGPSGQTVAYGQNGNRASMDDRDIKRLTPKVIEKITRDGGEVRKVVPREVALGRWKLDVDLARQPPPAFRRQIDYHALAVRVEPPAKPGPVRRHIPVEGLDN